MVVFLVVAGIGFLMVLAAVITIIVLSSKSGSTGDRCTNNKDCKGNRLCDPPTFQCRVERGGKCKNDDDCTTGNSCKSKKCVRNTQD